MDERVPEYVDEYISWFSVEQQMRLQEIRKLIREAVPEAEECISYRMPTYKHKGVLVHFGAFAKHFSFFPGGILKEPIWADRLTEYTLSKGTLQIRYNQALPKEVIRDILHERKLQNEMKEALKKSKSPKTKN